MADVFSVEADPSGCRLIVILCGTDLATQVFERAAFEAVIGTESVGAGGAQGAVEQCFGQISPRIEAGM
jgi:hypothetical protein